MRPLLLSAEGPFEKPLLALIGVSLGIHLLLFLLLSQGEPAIQDLPPRIEVELVDYLPLAPEPESKPVQPEPVAPQPRFAPALAAQPAPKARAAKTKVITATQPKAIPRVKPAMQPPAAAPAKPTLNLQPQLEGYHPSIHQPPPSSSQGQRQARGSGTKTSPSTAYSPADARPAQSGSAKVGSPGPAPLEPGLAAPQDTARERATLGPEEADQGYQAVEIAQPQAQGSRRAAKPRRPQPQVLAPGIVLEGDAAGRKVIYRPPLPRLEQQNEARITLTFVVLADGSVDQILPLVKGDPGLENLALEALARFRFDPAPAGTAPLKGKIHFTLKPGR